MYLHVHFTNLANKIDIFLEFLLKSKRKIYSEILHIYREIWKIKCHSILHTVSKKNLSHAFWALA